MQPEPLDPLEQVLDRLHATAELMEEEGAQISCAPLLLAACHYLWKYRLLRDAVAEAAANESALTWPPGGRR